MSFTSTSIEVANRTYYIESQLKLAIQFLYAGNYREAATCFSKVSHECKNNSNDCSLMAICKPTNNPPTPSEPSTPPNPSTPTQSAAAS